MNISERILKNAVKLGGNNLNFFTLSMTLKDLTSITSITLDGQALEKVAGNSYLFSDANGVTYGVIKRTNNSNTNSLVLSSDHMFPNASPTYIEVSADSVGAGGLIVAPGCSEGEPKEEQGISNFIKEAGSSANFKEEEFSVASKETPFHRALKSAGEDRIDIGDFVDSDGEGHIKDLYDAISSASSNLQNILKFEIGAQEYAAHQAVINNAFNGVSAWLLERAQGDLARQKLDYDHKYDVKDLTKNYVTSGITTLNSLLNIIAVWVAPTPTRDDLHKTLEERTIDLSFIVKSK